MFGGTYFAGAVFAGVVGVVGPLPPIPTDAGITIGGIPVTARVRLAGVSIRDVLNDAPNTASLTIEGEAPAVGQRIRITSGARLLFAGALQTIDQAFEGRPEHLAWHLTAIDDTADANARRPFGTFLDNYAWSIAETITAQFAPGFSPAGIARDLPPISIVFDGSETFIACLARIATAAAAYSKVEDRTVYLFRDPPGTPPASIADAHRFLFTPPITVNTDSSQLRTRVYGKGYGETIPADVAAGATQIPIEDGVMFPPLGGTAIVGLTAEGAQSDQIAFTGVDLGGGGTLVGPGAGPTSPPLLQLQGGSGVDTGLHTVSVVYLTALGTSLAGPPAEITTGTHPPPATAPTAGTPITGTGPDQGVHDYAASFVTSYGETVAGAISNAVTTSAAAGQLPTPGPPNAQFETLEGLGVDHPGQYDYVCTFINATGETLPSSRSTIIATRTLDVGGTPTPYHRINILGIPTGPAGTTGRRLYRRAHHLSELVAKLVTTIGNNTATTYVDATPTASLGAAEPTSNTTGTAVQRVPVSNIPIGPAGVQARALYRRFNGAGAFRLVTTIPNNTSTTFTDAVANSALGAAALTTATAAGNQIQATIPVGAAAVTAREVYMSPVASAPRRRVATLADNVTTTITITASDFVIAEGPTEPTADTSGLQQPSGQVSSGATVLPVASPAPFRPAGGWVTLAGGQVVRHSGISGNTLTGIPATGSGAITTTVLYGQQAIPAPMLIGVTGLTRPMRKGSAVHIWIQRDDLLAQAEHAARTGGDGIVEFLIVDGRRALPSLIARCDADLALFSRPIITVAYATRDQATASGKTVVIDLPSQGIRQTLTIQEVTITEIGLVPSLPPRYTVRASSVRFSLEDTLRRLIAGGQSTAHA